MQSPTTPTEDDLACIPTEHAVRNGLNLSAGNRKAAKRTFPWKLKADEIQLALSRPQDEDDYIRATKRPRLQDPIPTSTDEAPTENTTHGTTVALPLPATASDSDDSDPVTNTQPNVMTTGMSRHWTTEEDAKLTSATTNTPKKKHGKEHKKFTLDWVAISAQIPGRTTNACKNRWHTILDLSTDRANGNVLKGKWKEDEDIKLKNAVHKHGGKDWAAIAALVPGRTRSQCKSRWQGALDPINPANRRTGKWSEDEDIKLKNAVKKHGGKDWAAIAALVPDRTRNQCHHRWHHILDPSINPANGRTGKWTSDEDIKLKNAVHKHAGKDWVAIAALVPDRTMNQCRGRWHYALA
jgi:hypothetical protein